ncbi:hypothetical protein BDBG_01052 [Blastomyces gilchristii SLH14081]|uniref:Uncharacterized protein n=1 Tax=Blastomyces gilchristii (strain SLH14081) TaxID=559298 RepID=A0A179UB54_BLAGS|nr:uncharacterized protein BDBG_01052 [Blastomyces gilchristii SLH14081]OAT04509.1 hypothetical protein BDBG_01052 [Blastomyces gilchristii SLH14081]
MAIWPFGRRRKRPRKAADNEAFSGSAAPAGGDALVHVLSRGFGGHGSHQHQPNSHSSISGSGKATRRGSKRRKRNNIPPTTAYDLHHRNDNDTVRLTDLPPGAMSIASARFHRQPASVDSSLSRNFALSPSNYHYSPSTASQTSLGQAAPTLHGRRTSTEATIFKLKPSKCRRNDYSRELEIKNMTSHVTVLRRPSIVSPPMQWWESNKRGTRNIKTAHGPVSSQVSLHVDSGRSSPFDMESCAFKISSFAALTPRPILRYAEQPRYGLETRGHSRASTKKDWRQVIPAEDLTRISRIHDLADDMDASALKELMERDRRRKEMKRLADQQKLQRKLQRRADFQREHERRNPPVPSQLATSGDGVGLPASRVHGATEKIGVTLSSRIANAVKATASSESWLRDPSKESLHDTPSRPKDQTLSRVNGSSAVCCSPRGRSSNISRDISMSGMSCQHSIELSHGAKAADKLGASQAPETARGSAGDMPTQNSELEKGHSDSAGKLSTSWTAFFRRGGSRFRRPNAERTKTPSEFSIPSRESFQRINQQPASAQPIPIPDRSYLRPKMPPRSQSKFTEHFTEPITKFPPPPGRDFQSSSDPQLSSAAVGLPIAGITANNEHYNVDRDSAVVTFEQCDCNRSSGAGSPETNAESIFLAHSLASINSEGSWLSGRPSRRLSQPPKNSSSANSTKEILDEYEEYKYRVDNDYDPQPPIPLEEAVNENETLHASVGKRALLVRPDHRQFSNKDNIIVDDNHKHLYMETEGGDNMLATLVPEVQSFWRFHGGRRRLSGLVLILQGVVRCPKTRNAVVGLSEQWWKERSVGWKELMVEMIDDNDEEALKEEKKKIFSN